MRGSTRTCPERRWAEERVVTTREKENGEMHDRKLEEGRIPVDVEEGDASKGCDCDCQCEEKRPDADRLWMTINRTFSNIAIMRSALNRLDYKLFSVNTADSVVAVARDALLTALLPSMTTNHKHSVILAAKDVIKQRINGESILLDAAVKKFIAGA